MYNDFACWLTVIVFLMGAIVLLDKLFWAKHRESGKKPFFIIDWSHSFFFVLLIVWAIRSFVVQPYRVPTGSLEPTILPGDFILVNQFAYGVHFPLYNFKLFSTGKPEHGDIVLFRYPVNPNKIYIKRLVGLPGDHIQYINKVLYINGKQAPQKYLGEGVDVDQGAYLHPVEVKQENLDGVKHKIYIWKKGGLTQDFDVTVPKHAYFVMGDNRDNSDDSRFWGFVPAHNLVGEAMFTWMSWDSNHHRVRWHRIGHVIR